MTATQRDEALDRVLARAAQPADAPRPAPSAYGRVRRPPGPPGALTTLRMVSRQLGAHEVFDRMAGRYGPVAHVRLASEHVYLLSDPALVVEVLLTRARDTMKGRGLQAARPLVGNGLLTSEGEFHLRQRRLVQPAFHRSRIEEYGGQMVAEAVRHRAGWADGREVDMVAEMTSLTFAVVGRTLFGTDLTGDARAFGETLAELLDGFGRLSAIGNERVVRALPLGRRLLAGVDGLDVVVQRMIDEHRAEHARGQDRGDLLSWLVAARDDEASPYGARMTDEQLRDEVMTLVLAGHETTAMALSWTWWFLSSNPDAAQRLWAELDSVVGDREPTYDDLPALPWTHAVVAESIRLRPPAWIVGRRLLTDMEVGGWQVPSGSIVLASPYVMHRHPAYWPSPESYDPARWLDAAGAYDEAAPGVPRGAWFPFGWGNRKCIGDQFAWTEGVLVLATLARRWRASLGPDAHVVPLAGVTMRPRYGLPMVLHAR